MLSNSTNYLNLFHPIQILAYTAASASPSTLNTHTHNHFTALFDFVWDYPGEPAPER